MLTKKSTFDNIYMPMPANISYWWNFGSLLGISMIFQILSGLFLSMFYENSMFDSFNSINNINRNIMGGWMIRSMHANGASLLFFFIYMHMGRGLFFQSFNYIKVWVTGVSMFLVMMGIAFIGYVLPWGQMSFWGATVITNLLSSIPYVGNSMTVWIWGNFSINKTTLMRFFSLHFLMPFLLVGMIFLHLIFLHQKGSSNPLGIKMNTDKIPFQPFFVMKDILGFMFVMMLFLSICIMFPYILMDSDNFIPANPLNTPPHIQPEWYFLFAYAILRSVPNKLGGVIAMLSSIMILFFLPAFLNNKNLMTNKSTYKYIFYGWAANWIYLTIMGMMPVEPPFVDISKNSSMFYFSMYVMQM